MVVIFYPAILTPQPEGGYVVTFPDVPEAITQGDTIDEALDHAIDALETALTFYDECGQPHPVPRSCNENNIV